MAWSDAILRSIVTMRGVAWRLYSIFGTYASALRAAHGEAGNLLPRGRGAVTL
jgi:hypothetical protein